MFLGYMFLYMIVLMMQQPVANQYRIKETVLNILL
jgi:hypothetical protein